MDDRTLTFDIRPPSIQILLCRWRNITEWAHQSMAAPFWRLYWNQTPGAWLERDGQRLTLDLDQLTLISPGSPIKTGNTQPFDHFFIHFSMDHEWSLGSDLIHQISVPPNERDSLQVLMGTALEDQLPTRQFTSTCLQLIYSCLLTVPEESWNPAITDHRIRKALNLIQIENRQPVNVTKLANAVSLHPKSFTRLFKEVMGVPPYQYSLSKRLDGAATELINTHASVEQIAEAWGFSDRYHLTKLLKRYRSCTPGSLRRQDLK